MLQNVNLQGCNLQECVWVLKIATFEGFRSLSILRGQDFLQWCIGFSK